MVRQLHGDLKDAWKFSIAFKAVIRYWIAYIVGRNRKDGFMDSKYCLCPLLVKMVEAGFLGKKNGSRLLHLLIDS